MSQSYPNQVAKNQAIIPNVFPCKLFSNFIHFAIISPVLKELQLISFN